MVENLFICILWNAEVRFQTDEIYQQEKEQNLYQKFQISDRQGQF